MPTKEELQAEAAATGVPYNTLLARDYKAKTYGTPASELQLGEGIETSEAPVEPMPTPQSIEPVQPLGMAPEQSVMPGQQPAPLESTQDIEHLEKLKREAISFYKINTGKLPDEKWVLGQVEKFLKTDPYPSQMQQMQPEQEQAPERGKAMLMQPQAPGAGGGVGGGGIGMPSAKGMIGAAEAIPEQRRKQLEQITREAEDAQKAIEGLAQIDQQIQSDKAGILINRQIEMEKVQGEQLAREQKRQAAVETELGKVRDAVETMKASKIDPYRFYKHPDGSTDFPKSVAAVIAVGLGALGSSLPRSMGGTGGPNMALSILDKSIDRDLQAQRDDLANQRAGVGIQMNLLGQMRAQFSDERSAESAARIMMLETTQAKLDATVAKSGSERLAANAAVLTADLNARKNAEYRKIEEGALTGELQAEQLKYNVGMGQAKAKMAARAANVKATQGAAAPHGLRELPGYEPASSKEKLEDRKVVKAMGSAYRQAKTSIDAVIAWRDKCGAEFEYTEDMAEGNTLMMRALKNMLKLDKAGANVSELEQKMTGIRENIGDYGWVMRELRTLDKSTKDQTNAAMFDYGHALKGVKVSRMGEGQ